MVRDTGVTVPFMGPLASVTMGLAFCVNGLCMGSVSVLLTGGLLGLPTVDSNLGWALPPWPCSCEALTAPVPLEAGAA